VSVNGGVFKDVVQTVLKSYSTEMFENLMDPRGNNSRVFVFSMSGKFWVNRREGRVSWCSEFVLFDVGVLFDIVTNPTLLPQLPPSLTKSESYCHP
jgi:hypothetical protein